MTWTRISTIQTTADWLLTESVSGSLFRISHNITGINIQSVRSVIAQAFDEGANNTYFDFRRLAYKPETEAFLFLQPAGLLNRKLAIKRLDALADDWTITIEVLDGMPTSISLPITISEVNGLQAALNDKAAAESLNIHVADTENPHEVTPEKIGAEIVGAGSAAAAQMIDIHLNDLDPHPQYANDAEIASLLSAVNNKEAVGTAVNAIAFHEAAADPHQQYATDFQINNLLLLLADKEAIGVAADLIATLTAAQIPQTLPTAMTIDYEGTIAANGILTVNGLVWLLLDGATIGNASSAASRYADAKAQTLFERLWSNPNLAMFAANGATSTKGVSALADFEASKRLALPDARGRVIIAAGQGLGLTIRNRGSMGGAETHTLTNAQQAPHSHDINAAGGIPMAFRTSGTDGAPATHIPRAPGSTGTYVDPLINSSTGGGQPHNIIQPFYVSSGKLILAGKA